MRAPHMPYSSSQLRLFLLHSRSGLEYPTLRAEASCSTGAQDLAILLVHKLTHNTPKLKPINTGLPTITRFSPRCLKSAAGFMLSPSRRHGLQLSYFSRLPSLLLGLSGRLDGSLCRRQTRDGHTQRRAGHVVQTHLHIRQDTQNKRLLSGASIVCRLHVVWLCASECGERAYLMGSELSFDSKQQRAAPSHAQASLLPSRILQNITTPPAPPHQATCGAHSPPRPTAHAPC